MKHILLLLALAFGAPIVLSAALFNPLDADIPELAPWTLMLLGVGGTGLTLRAARGAVAAA